MMTAACVPWNENYEFAEAVFRKEVQAMVAADIKSIYIFGTAGEGYAVSDETFATVAAVFRDEMKAPGLLPMVCVIGVSMQEMVKRIGIAYELGFRDFQLAFPAWGALRATEVDSFFRATCGAFGDCRFLHYNNGNRSKTKLLIQDYLRLEQRFPNLVGAKYSTQNVAEIQAIMKADSELVFYFVDSGYTFGSMFGRCGFLNSFASVDFELSWKHFEAGYNRDYETLLTMENYLFELNQAFAAAPEDRIDAAYDKAIERVSFPELSQRLYPPYEGLSDEEFEAVKARMLQTVRKYRQGKIAVNR